MTPLGEDAKALRPPYREDIQTALAFLARLPIAHRGHAVRLLAGGVLGSGTGKETLRVRYDGLLHLFNPEGFRDVVQKFQVDPRFAIAKTYQIHRTPQSIRRMTKKEEEALTLPPDTEAALADLLRRTGRM